MSSRSQARPGARAEVRARVRAQALRIVAALALTGVTGASSVASAPPGTASGYFWPAGFATGALLWGRARQAPYLAVLVLGVAAVTFLPGEQSLGVVLASAASIAAEAYVVNRLVHRSDDGWPWLARTRDVAGYVLACSAGAGVGAAGFVLTSVVTGTGIPWEIGIGVFSGHLASLLVLVPLFLRVLPSLARPVARERALRLGLTLAVAVVAVVLSLPSLAFILLPVLGWSSVRAPLRENQLLVLVVAATAGTLTQLGLGPFHGLNPRLTDSPELAMVPMYSFVVACALVCIPFAVSVRAHNEALRDAATQRRRSDRLIHGAQGLVIIGTDDLGRINLFNPGAERVLGYTAEEVMGRSPAIFHSPAEIARLAAELRSRATYADVTAAFMARELVTPMDWEFRRKDGERRILSYLVTPTYAGDVLTGLLATADDMTERVEMQERLEKALVRALAAEGDAISKLAEVDRAKDSFVSAVTHELRTPITNLIGYLEMLQDGSYGELSAEQGQALGRIDLNSQRLLSLVDDLLTLARLDEAHPSGPPTAVDMVELVEKAATDVQHFADTHELVVLVEVPDEPVLVRGDAGQLGRLVANLADNAAKFTPPGGTITLRLRREAVTARLEVVDTGMGIPPNEQDQVFSRFFRTSTAEEGAIPGTGLGLFIARAIVEAHGADISFDSTPGRGTTFTVRLALSDP